MCNCLSWAKTPEMTNHEGRYQMAWHHPNCEDFITKEYTRVACDGSFVILLEEEIADFYDGENEDLVFSKVQLTDDQYEALAEFEGF